MPAEGSLARFVLYERPYRLSGDDRIHPEVVFEALPDADHKRKWGQLTFTREGDWHHWICAISPTTKAVRLVIHKGALLADPRGVMIGEARYSRAIPFREPEEIDADVVTPILVERLPPGRRRCGRPTPSRSPTNPEGNAITPVEQR